MLRKKLSKLIVGTMAVAMLAGGVAGAGQAVFANESVQAISNQVRAEEQTVTLGTTTGQQVIDYIKDTSVKKIIVKGGTATSGTHHNELDLNATGTSSTGPSILDAINERVKTTPLTIELAEGINNKETIIVMSTSTNDLKLEGNNNLTIVRGTGHKGGSLLEVKTGVQGNVNITGVKFQNGNSSDSVFKNSSTAAGKKATLEANTLESTSGNATLAENSTNTEFKKNTLNNNLLVPNQKTDLSLADPYACGANIATLSATLMMDHGDGKPTAGGIKATGEVTIKETKGSMTFNVDISNGSTKVTFEGLTPGTDYTANLLIKEFSDANENKYTRELKVENKQFKTYDFSSSVSNITNSSATINLTHGKDVSNTTAHNHYPLELIVKNGTSVEYTVEIKDKDVKSVDLSDLIAGTNYTYEIKEKGNNGNGHVIYKGEFRTTSSTISGGGNNGSNNNNSSVSGDLTTSDINKATINDVDGTIPVGNTALANSLKNGKDFKTNIEGVTVTFTNGKFEFKGLVPGKEYKNVTITYTDKDSKTKTVKVPTFKTKESSSKLRQFITDVYKYSLDRSPDERGFAYWEDQLNSKKTSPADFVKNLLNEVEFITKHKTTNEKIEGLYKVIVNRSSDAQGLSYWTKKYDDLVKVGYTDSMALNAVSDEMVNEKEFKNRVLELGL